MKEDVGRSVLRLQRYHEPDPEAPPDIDAGRRLLAVQSLRNAVVASLVVILLFSLLWSLLSLALERIFPWLSLLLGLLLGLAVRRAGLGIDWRFPVLAAGMAAVGSFVAYVIVAAGFASDEYDGSIAGLLLSLDVAGWQAFLAQVITPADVVFAGFSAAIAAFFSTRRLTRRQYLALRLYRQSLSR